MAKHTMKKDKHSLRQRFDDYKSSLNRYAKSAKNPPPGRCSPSPTRRERRMDFVPENPALEVDGASPSRLGGVGASGEGAVEEAYGEVLLPIMAGEEDEPALMRAIVEEEL
jgi:hypothetical protein